MQGEGDTAQGILLEFSTLCMVYFVCVCVHGIYKVKITSSKRRHPRIQVIKI